MVSEESVVSVEASEHPIPRWSEARYQLSIRCIFHFGTEQWMPFASKSQVQQSSHDVMPHHRICQESQMIVGVMVVMLESMF